MKKRLLIAVALLALLSSLNSQLSTLFAQGTAFTYQGRLTANGSLANGNYDLRFNLYTNSSVGNPVTAGLTNPAVNVVNGLFTTTLDFGGVFNGTIYWLDIGARTNGSAVAFVPLTARQQLTPSPYAIFAESAGHTASNSVTAANLVLPLLLDHDQPFVPTLDVRNSSASGNAVEGHSASAIGISGYSDSFEGVYGAGAKNGVHGVCSSAGTSSAGVFGENSAVGGTAVIGNALNTDSAGVAGVADTARSTGVYGRGNSVGVLGTSSTRFGTGVSGTSLLGPGVYGTGIPAGHFDGDVDVTGNESFGSTTRQMLNLWSTAYGIGVQNNAGYFRTGGEYFWYRGGTHSDTFGDAGGGTQLMRLGNSGGLIVAGSVTTPVLTITGGADVAEPFQMSAKEIPKGSVVVIDESSPGQLKMSERPNDTRVAGIVSGANGIKPGISLSQQGVIEGGQNVALSGRVYVLADASSGPIKPGDLLTTSNTPGHAMKVKDHAKAQGAIIGKAMSALPNGKGMVLVLVTLQ